MRSWSGLALGLAIATTTSAFAQEVLPPTPIGGGNRITRQFQGQIIEVSATGNLEAMISYAEVSSRRIAGSAVLTNQGSGTVTVRWWNRSLETWVALEIGEDMKTFELQAPAVRRSPTRPTRD